MLWWKRSARLNPSFVTENGRRAKQKVRFWNEKSARKSNLNKKSPLDSLRFNFGMGLGVNGLRKWKGPRVASRDPYEIKETVTAQSERSACGGTVYAREALVAKSQLRVKVNKIGPRASELGPHCMKKCPLKQKMSAPVGQRSVGVAYEKEGPHVLVIVVPGSSRIKTVSAREEDAHTLRVK